MFEFLSTRFPQAAQAALIAGGALVLTACGGGGGGDGSDSGNSNNPPVVAPGGTSPVAGGWSGSATSSGEAARVFVTADGTMWAFLSASEVPMDLYAGGLTAATGQLSASTLRAFDFQTKTAAAATATGSYTAGSAMNVTITPVAGTATTIALTSIGSADYAPGAAASMATITGGWGGSFLPGETGVVSILGDGTVNTITSEGCSSAGVVTARANENVFDMQLVLGPAPCAAPGATAVGSIFIVGSGSGARMYMGVKTADGSQGAGFIGVKQ